jgi:hypothetical protein
MIQRIFSSIHSIYRGPFQGVARGLRGMDLTDPPRKAPGTPSQPPMKYDQMTTKKEDRIDGRMERKSG